MKCVAKTRFDKDGRQRLKVDRVDDDRAAFLVKYKGWRYCPKRFWKAMNEQKESGNGQV